MRAKSRFVECWEQSLEGIRSSCGGLKHVTAVKPATVLRAALGVPLVRIATLTPVLAACISLVGLLGSASAAIYWTHIDWATGAEEIGRSNLDGSNADPDFITMPRSQGYSPCGGVAVDATHLYWAANGLGKIGRANLDGSDANPEFITDVGSPCGIAIDSAYIYWTNSDYAKSQWHIGRAKLDGTDVEPELLNAGRAPCSLASFGSDLYGRSLDPEGSEFGIYRTASDGSGVPDLYIPSVEAGCGIAISGEYIYWTDFEGSIGRARLDGTQVEPQFISGLVRPCGIAVHAGVLYWSEQPFIGQQGSISRANTDGSDVQRGIVSGLREPCQLAVNDAPAQPEPETLTQPIRLNLGPVRHNRRTGSVLVAINMSAPGSLDIRVPRQFHARLLRGFTQVGAGRSWLKITLGRGSIRTWPRDALRRKGRVQLTLVVGFVPVEGPNRLRVKVLSMWRKPLKAH